MKKYSPILLCIVGVAALVMSSATTAQPRLPNVPRPQPWYEARMAPGQQILVNGSNNTVVEVVTDLTISAKENLQYTDLNTGKTYLLPNGANNVRLQGNVVISRDAAAASATPPTLRWRYVETIWPAWPASSPANPQPQPLR